MVARLIFKYYEKGIRCIIHHMIHSVMRKPGALRMKPVHGSYIILCVIVTLVLGMAGCSNRTNGTRVQGSTAVRDARSIRQDVASTVDLQLSWDAPSHNADGTALTDLAGYTLYYGRTSGRYTSSLKVGNQTTYTLTGLPPGHTYYVALKAYDASGNESDFSAEMQATIPRTKPSPSLRQQTSFVRGQRMRFQVTDANPGEVVSFLFSITGEGDGPCSPNLGGLCVDLLNPQVFGQATADTSGTATLVMPIPLQAPAGQKISTQAVIPRGRDGADSIKTNIITDTVR